MAASRSSRSHAVATLVLAVLLLAASAPRAGATVIASSSRGFDGGPALASDGRLVVGELRGNGALAVLAIDPLTRTATGLAASPPLADPLTYNVLDVSGTGGVVTASVRRFREATGPQSGPEHDIPVPKGSRVSTLLPFAAPLSACARRQTFSDHDAAGGDGFVASIGGECAPTSTVVTIRHASGTLTIPAAPETSPFAGEPPTPNIKLLRAAGPMVSWVEEHHDPRGGVLRTVVVARGATGQVLLRAVLPAFPAQIGLGRDGTVAFTGLICSIGIVSPAAPAVRELRLPANLCPFSRSSRSLAVAGGRIVFGASTGYAIADLQGAVRPLAEARPRAGNVGSPVAFDGRTIFVVDPGCFADHLLAIDADLAAGPLPAAQQLPKVPCPLRRSGSGRLRAGSDGRVRIALHCEQGCRGTLRLVQQRAGRRERLVGEAAYGHAPGPVVVRVRLAAYARRLAGCAGGLRANAIVFASRNTPGNLGSRGLGAYRITSASTCRRTGGPPFSNPRRGPRP